MGLSPCDLLPLVILLLIRLMYFIKCPHLFKFFHCKGKVYLSMCHESTEGGRVIALPILSIGAKCDWVIKSVLAVLPQGKSPSTHYRGG